MKGTLPTGVFWCTKPDLYLHLLRDGVAQAAHDYARAISTVITWAATVQESC